MELANHISAVIILGFLFVALWIFYFWFYQRYTVDNTRQELFAIRDEMFDFAAAGNISFDHPAYIMLRRTMNGMIRFSHKLNLITLIAILVVERKNNGGREFQKQLASTLSDIEPSIKEKMYCYHYSMNTITIKHFIKNSLILILALIFIGIVIAFLKGMGKGMGNLKGIIITNFPGISSIDNEAALIGSQ